MPGIQAGWTDELLHGNVAVSTGTFASAKPTVGADGRVTACSSSTQAQIYKATASVTNSGVGSDGSLTLIGSGTGSLSITSVSGQNLVIEAGGVYTTSGSPVYGMKILKGSTTLMSTSTFSVGTGTAISWYVRFVVTFLSTTSVIINNYIWFNQLVDLHTTTATTVNSTAETVDLQGFWNNTSQSITSTTCNVWYQ